MDSPLPPDPYDVLGVAKDATAEAIKKEYRKLVLKSHPDKVQDDSKKQAAADLFHKIQTAYEIVGNEARRHRYDAQCKLAELRKEIFERDGGGGARDGTKVRTAGYDVPPEPPRGDDYFSRQPEYPYTGRPVYEERRPSYAEERWPGYAEERRPSFVDEFEAPLPRPAARKDAEFERSAKRASPRTDRGRARGGSKKENERSTRKEKSKRTDKDQRQERERKFHAYVEPEQDTESDSDQYARAQRRMREEDEERKRREAFYAKARPQGDEAERGAYADERARKMFESEAVAREYMQRATQQPRADSERRPSPVRKASSKDKVEYTKRDGKTPIVIRRGLDRPKANTRDSERRKSPAAREAVRPTPDIVEEPPTPIVEPTRRPPTLNPSKSSPADSRPPFERRRSHSMQEDAREERVPPVRRSDTMPESPIEELEHQRRRDSRRKEGSKLRTEIKESYLTPEPTPESPQSKRYNYGYDYCDDGEYATPEGYKTEYREPTPRRYTRSPSPIKERERERARTGASRRVSPQSPPPMPRSVSHQYVFPEGNIESSYKRPAVSREGSARLYGELPTPRSPRQSQGRYTPDINNIQYTRDPRPEDVRMQSGYRPRSGERPPSYNRSASAQQSVYVK